MDEHLLRIVANELPTELVPMTQREAIRLLKDWDERVTEQQAKAALQRVRIKRDWPEAPRHRPTTRVAERRSALFEELRRKLQTPE